MTIDELYLKIQVDDALKEEAQRASEPGTLTEWVHEQGVDATEGELMAFASSRPRADDVVELSDEDLMMVAGGGAGTNYEFGVQSVCSYGTDVCSWELD
jgi:putative intracellular protease/amidase